MDTGYLIMNISKKLKYDLNHTLLEKGVTVQQWAVIQQLSQTSSLTAVDLVQILDMDKPTISGIVQRLEKKGLLTKNKHPSDKRAYLLSLTESGKESLEECKKISEEVVEEYLAVLTVQEKKQLNQLLTKINEDKREQ